jgi:tRNA dimethylallyltransferase
MIEKQDTAGEVSPRKVLLISGPTGSGKSALAVHLAKKLGGEIINIDSVQIYRGAQIGAATIRVREMQGVPHHLLGFVDPNEAWDVQRMAEKVAEAVDEVRKRAHMPILVGGGGMYVSTLFGGISKLPKADPSLRKKLESKDNDSLHLLLTSLDSERASQLHPNDRLRVIRAIEIIELKSSENNDTDSLEYPPWVTGLSLVLLPERAQLYEVLEHRVDQMISDGLIDEVAELIDKTSLSHALKNSSIDNGSDRKIQVIWRAIGYSHGRDLLEGKISYEQFLIQLKQSTRQFAKRQYTYWKNEPRKRGWIISEDCKEGTSLRWITERDAVNSVLDRGNSVSYLPFFGSKVMTLLK